MRGGRWCAGLVVLLVWGEWQNRRWSRTLVRPDTGQGSEAIVVLGFRNPGRRINAINRWRVRIGVRSVTGHGDDTTMIFSGGARDGRPAEARLMADYARSSRGFLGQVLVEDRSRSTWENVTNVVPLIERAARIKVASQPAHALKARGYLWRQRPDLADRLVTARDYRVGEWFVVKPMLAVHGLWSLRGRTREDVAPRAGQSMSALPSR